MNEAEEENDIGLLRKYKKIAGKYQKSIERGLKRIIEIEEHNAKTRQQLKWLQKQIALLLESDAIVSEHALLRYLQRVKGFDLAAYKKEIFTPALMAKLKSTDFADGIYRDEAHSIVLKERTIVSILTIKE